MFRVYFTNFFYFSQEEFSSLAEAKAYGIGKTFEFSVWEGEEMRGFWSFFGGWRDC